MRPAKARVRLFLVDDLLLCWFENANSQVRNTGIRNMKRFIAFGLTSILTAAVVSLSISGAEAVTRAERSKAFVNADKNSDEVLTRAEFKVFIKDLAKQRLPLAKRVRFWGVYGLAFGRIDTNKDGLLQPAELLQADKNFKDCTRAKANSPACGG